MQISNFLVSKPGGMTIAEALIKEIPLIIMSPLPGQEQRNEQFIVNMGAAVTIEDTNNIDTVLYQIIENPIRIKHMKEMSRNLARPNAVENIVSLVEKLIKI
jgi:processive 1,2-diacylglycerol beta-glucosyltransferase